MKSSLYLLPLGLFFIYTPVSAQKANIDSLKLVAQISQDQLKLGKLQNLVEQQTKDKKGAAADAQNSANNNAIAAEKLNVDPDNKKLARDANNKAGTAKSDARKSRRQSVRLEDLNKDIKELKDKIAVGQAQLDTYRPNVVLDPVTLPIVDTTLRP